MKRALALALACALVVMVGCSKGPKKPADLPALQSVACTVTYEDGEAIEGATVVFRAKQTGGRTWNVVGQTDVKGVATMMTDGNWTGAPAGDYEVMVSKQVSEVEDGKAPGESATLKGVTNYIDLRFNDPHTSGLTASVKDGQNSFEFKVGAKLQDSVKTLEN